MTTPPQRVIRPGLVSITFRQKTAEGVCRLAADNGLRCIEWGGDVHVPPGDTDAARRVARLSDDHGLEVAAYGSYFRLGVHDRDAFDPVVASASTLGAPRIRVWCGERGSAEHDHADRQRVVEAGRDAAERAAAAGLTVVAEWHGNTLTDTADSATRLLREIDHPRFKTYWQPPQGMPPDDCQNDLAAALPWCVGVHVFHWRKPAADAPVDRRPLDEGAAVWPGYLDAARNAGGLAAEEPLDAMIEFVRGDEPTRLAHDARALRGWIEALA